MVRNRLIRSRRATVVGPASRPGYREFPGEDDRGLTHRRGASDRISRAPPVRIPARRATRPRTPPVEGNFRSSNRPAIQAPNASSPRRERKGSLRKTGQLCIVDRGLPPGRVGIAVKRVRVTEWSPWSSDVTLRHYLTVRPEGPVANWRNWPRSVPGGKRPG